jgi:MFS family permease
MFLCVIIIGLKYNFVCPHKGGQVFFKNQECFEAVRLLDEEERQVSESEMSEEYKLGIEHNRGQFIHQLIQVFFTGMTVGMTRTVIPALAEDEFGVAKGSFLMLTLFVGAFGLSKSIFNFAAGRLAETFGRKKILLLGWMTACPVPIIIFYADHWNWIVFATILLGVNQGLAWSMTQTSKMDITAADERGITMGLNEFAGYLGVAIAGIVTAYVADYFGARMGLLLFGLLVILAGSVMCLIAVKETLPWARAEERRHQNNGDGAKNRHYFKDISDNPTTWEIFTLMSWRDRRMAILCQAGLVEKFVDALIWVFYPVYFYTQGVSLSQIGIIVGIYGFVWGASQFYTGKLSDRMGRLKPIIWGMWLCGIGVVMTLFSSGVVYWSFTAGITGFGMALLYPNLSAAVVDISHPSWKSSAIGVYRFWRDLGYAIGAVALGVVGNLFDSLESGFYFVAIAMFFSGLLVWLWGKETYHS